MINYTEDQKNAINYFDSDLIISASAGSGKTQVLLEKVVKLIEMGYKIDEMLVVTFTNMAAGEMKSKLENMLEAKFAETKDSKFFDALKQLNVSDISTIHAFCQKLIKKYYYYLSINPNFDIKDENFLYYLKNLALDKTFEGYFNNNDEEFANLANLFIYKRDYKVFKEEILSFYEFLVSKVDKYNFIASLIENNYKQDLNSNELIEKFKNYCEKFFENFRQEILNISFDAQKISCDKIIDLCNQIHAILCFNFGNNEMFVKTFFNSFEFPRIQISNKSEVEAVLLKEKLQTVVKDIKSFIKNLNNIFNFESTEQIKLSIEKSKKLLMKFVEVVKTFEENFKLIKNENNCFDFNDMEALTLKLFENEKILDEISSKYKFIFVDEYQDTNLVQEEILKSLSKNCKRIMVGDLKQSIYAFRECNPKILNDKMKDFQNNSTGKVIELNKNFRSRPEILEFSNNIFKNIMQKENCDYDYSSHGMFVCGREDFGKTQKPICVLCVDKQSENFKNPKQSENILILNAINNLLKKKIIENGVERNLTYKDIALISRKRNERFNMVCEFLQQNKIPTNVKYYEKIYDSFEIKLILSYLQILNNKTDEISMVSVLKNIYDVTDNELIYIKNNDSMENIFQYNKDDMILKKINVFKEDYNYFSNLIFELSVKNLIKEIIRETNLDLKLLRIFGKISEERINVFLNSVNDAEFNLFKFLHYIDKIKDKKFEVRKIDGENSVIIDTFHSTKGLEYNAVIIFGAGDSLFSKNNSSLIYNASLGIGIYDFDEENKIKNPNFVYSVIKILNKQEEFNEEARLCYVAFTRAKNFMIICGAEKKDNLKVLNNPLQFLNFTSYLSLICSSGFEDFVDFKVLEEDDEIFCDNDEKADLEEKIKLDYNMFDSFFEKPYDFASSQKVQLKNSVTSLSEEDDINYNISNFKITDLDKEDFIAVGNAYHHTLEKIPFSLNSVKEVHNKIVNLIENQDLNLNVYSYIEDEKIFKAIENIKTLIEKDDKIFKEKVFLMNIAYNDVSKTKVDDKILIQGIIDLMIEKENEIILIDYKTSRLNDAGLIKKYSLQLKLYEKAISEKFKNKKITKYIYSIFLDKLINVV